jgi:hypothetical protein
MGVENRAENLSLARKFLTQFEAAVTGQLALGKAGFQRCIRT